MNKMFIEQLNIQLPAGWEGQSHMLARMVSDRIQLGNRSLKTVNVPALQLSSSATMPEVAQHIANAINQQLTPAYKQHNQRSKP